eukprot:2019545-Pleurochrysis_carterae.AAC.7
MAHGVRSSRALRPAWRSAAWRHAASRGAPACAAWRSSARKSAVHGVLLTDLTRLQFSQRTRQN